MTDVSKPTAVLYAAKSTADPRGSIPTQLADCRAAAEVEGREIAAKYSDEAASAYKGNRGEGLTAAKNHAIRLGSELWVQHSDRLARGDGITADHLAEIWFALRRHGVKLRSVQDDSNLEDAIRVVLIGERNNEDSKRKGQAVSAGQRRRHEAGKALGSPLPDGYTLQVVDVGRDGRVTRERVLDPERAPIWRRIFDLIEKGHSFGEVRETLNAEGIRTKRGKPWTTRAIRRGVRDERYAGTARNYGEPVGGAYPPLIEPDRWERIRASLPESRTPRTPSNATTQEWLLQGIVHCGRCGSKLYTRADHRQYVCKAVREGHGSCDARPIPADQAERMVLDHLGDFVGDVEEWLAGQTRSLAQERDQFGQSLDLQRRELRKLDLRAQRANELADGALDDGDDATAAAALRKAEATREDRDQLAEAIEAGEAKLSDWPTVPDVDAALDFYSELRDAVQGRISGSQTIAELRAHLRTALGEATLDYKDGDLFGWFRLKAEHVKPGRLPCGGLVSGPGLEPIELDREVADTTS